MGIFFEGKVTSLNVKTSDGYSGILPNHAPIIAPIEPSVLKFSQGEKIFVAVIANGFLYLEPNSARILTDEIVYEKDVDELRASKLLELEQRKLNDIKNKEDEILIRSQIKYFTSQINVKKDKKILQEITEIYEKVDSYREEYSRFSDEALKNETEKFRREAESGKSLSEMLPRAYAVAREGSKRIVGEFPYKVQVMGAIILHHGDIAEMKTGEDDESKGITLTSSGQEKAESFFNLKYLYDVENSELLHFIHNALRANYVFTKDVEYIVRDGEILLVDLFTGRIMIGRSYSDGLQQAIQAKENVEIQPETRTMATITYQNYFRLYKKICGMTGTAKTEEDELRSIYNTRVICVPTNRPIIRRDRNDLIYGNLKAKYEAMIKRIELLHSKGQPVLVGTANVDVSELISRMLTEKNIQHNVLNAKNHMTEAEIIANAGKKGTVTISTNMAGRGTDIKLGEGVKELGGLFVIGSERHESRRVDNQLRGRSGRQGDVGESRFYLSVEDDLLMRFGSDRFKALFAKLGNEPIRSKLLSKAIENAQRRIEGLNFDSRKNLLEYDNVLSKQREVIYDQRDQILLGKSLDAKVERMLKLIISHKSQESIIRTEEGDKIDYTKLISSFREVLPEFYVSEEDAINASYTGLNNIIFNQLMDIYHNRIATLPEDFLNFFHKSVLISTLDKF
uniref:Uncharacterized protein n=1 Tax=Biomphalaria glabrata TaxID=6526 RepID=A0A2C9JR41_BIOGL